MSGDDGSPLGDDPLQTARDLADALKGMTGQLTAVRAAVRRSKRVIIALAVSLLLDIALTVTVTVAAVQSGDASDRASSTVTQLHASNVSACRQANVARAQDIAIWNTFLGELAPPSARTPAVAAKLAVINAAIRVKDAPRDCSKIYATKGLAMPAVPGDTTANPLASVPKVTVMGRCPRCERWPWEQKCGGTAHA